MGQPTSMVQPSIKSSSRVPLELPPARLVGAVQRGWWLLVGMQRDLERTDRLLASVEAGEWLPAPPSAGGDWGPLADALVAGRDALADLMTSETAELKRHVRLARPSVAAWMRELAARALEGAHTDANLQVRAVPMETRLEVTAVDSGGRTDTDGLAQRQAAQLLDQMPTELLLAALELWPARPAQPLEISRAGVRAFSS